MIDRRSLLKSGAFFAAAALTGARAGAADAEPGWRELPTEAFPGKQDDISFVTPDLGWYGNGLGKLFKTTDGGESWTKVWEQTGTFIRALGFVDAENGYLGNVGTDYYPNVTDTQPLYRTRDGGTTWEPVAVPDSSFVKGICGIDILTETRIFQGERRSVPVIHAAGRVGGPAAILRSADGGETWRCIDLRPHAGMILDVKFFDAETGFVCAASSDDLSQANALILRTTDGGSTWTKVYRSDRPFENCWKMFFASETVGYATVQNYAEGVTKRVVVKTVDGGASWSELALAEGAKIQEFGIGFVDDKHGWVGAMPGGFETLDGGETWIPADIGIAVNKIRVVKDATRTRVFAIGKSVKRLDL